MMYFRYNKAVSGKSRLIREDEHDKSDEDEDEEGLSRHMTFGKKVEPARQLQVSLVGRLNKFRYWVGFKCFRKP